jgi:ectoine hydroxylase-related dioxygenase (phytanoyl-CoA dioxygenase family)
MPLETLVTWRQEMDQRTNGESLTEVGHLGVPSTASEDGFRLITEHVAEIDKEIRGAGLERHAYELDLNGYTVIENALQPEQVETLRRQLLSIGGQDDGRPIDPLGGTHENRTQEILLLLARGGRPFEELVLHPLTLPLITYLLGQSCTISSVTGYIKGPGRTALGVHSDTAYVPDPLPPYAQLANVNYCLSDYTVADGCLRVVPGSHRYCHRPRDGQGAAEAVPVEAPAGAAIVFHGNTWHGAYPRTSSGLRLTLSTLFCRMYIRPQERYDEIINDETLDRNPARLRRLVGKDVPTGWRSTADAERILGLRKVNAPTYYRTRSEYA